jgi:hypothetical protein
MHFLQCFPSSSVTPTLDTLAKSNLSEVIVVAGFATGAGAGFLAATVVVLGAVTTGAEVAVTVLAGGETTVDVVVLATTGVALATDAVVAGTYI